MNLHLPKVIRILLCCAFFLFAEYQSLAFVTENINFNRLPIDEQLKATISYHQSISSFKKSRSYRNFIIVGPSFANMIGGKEAFSVSLRKEIDNVYNFGIVGAEVAETEKVIDEIYNTNDKIFYLISLRESFKTCHRSRQKRASLQATLTKKLFSIDPINDPLVSLKKANQKIIKPELKSRLQRTFDISRIICRSLVKASESSALGKDTASPDKPDNLIRIFNLLSANWPYELSSAQYFKELQDKYPNIDYIFLPLMDVTKIDEYSLEQHFDEFQRDYLFQRYNMYKNQEKVFLSDLHNNGIKPTILDLSVEDYIDLIHLSPQGIHKVHEILDQSILIN